MEINQKYRDAIDKATKELLSLSKEEFFARLDQHKDGPISTAMKELEEFMQWRQDDFEEKLIEKVRTFLGKEGIGFFNGMLEKHGEISPVFNEGGIPHAVHFREGMQVRNFLRGLPECEGWTTDDFDDYWGKLVEDAINECDN